MSGTVPDVESSASSKTNSLCSEELTVFSLHSAQYRTKYLLDELMKNE